MKNNGPAVKAQGYSKSSRAEYVFIFLLLAASLFLLFYGLGTRYLWQDEAQTPLIAKTILHTGFPYGTDGLNFFSQEGGIEYGRNYLWKWHPWLPFYISALSIRLFGEGNFAYRFPFALFGLASVILVYFMMKRLTGLWRKAAFCAAGVALSTAFLLLARQCRYYSVEMFFIAGSLLFYADYMRNRSKGTLLLLFIFLTGIFHTLYIYFFVLLAAFGLHQFLFPVKRDKNLVVVLMTSLLFNLPFLFSIYSIEFSRANGNMFDAARVLHMIKTYCLYTLKYLFPYFAVFFAAVMFGLRLRKGGHAAAPEDTTMILMLFTLASLVFIPILTPSPFFRNLAGTVIPLAILSGILCFRLFEMNKAAGVALAIAVVFASPLVKFVNEITGSWKEAGGCIVEFINANSSPGDEVLITYPDMPLKLYTGLKVHGGLTGDDLSNIKEPDFVIMRRDEGSDYERATLAYIKRLDIRHYMLYRLPCGDRLWENREDIDFHDFGPDNKMPGVNVYKLIRKESR